MRPWTGNQSHALYADTMSVKPLSKLDNAKLTLAKLKLKYGKQEKQLHGDPPSSSTSLSSRTTSPTYTDIPKVISKEPSENSVLVERHSEVKNCDTSESFESDSLKSVSSKELHSRHLPKLPVCLTDAKLINSGKGSTISRSDSSVSELHENIRSFSLLEIGHQIQDEEVSLTSVPNDLVVNNVASAFVLERDTTETSISSIVDTLQSESGVARTELRQMAPAAAAIQEMSDPDMMPSESTVAHPKLSQMPPATAAIQETEIPDMLQSESTVAQTEPSLMAPAAVIQETSNGTPSGAANGITLQSGGKSSERVSSVTLVSIKKERRVRSVKVQTDRKRSRTVQVSLSEHSYEGQSRSSYPILRASSLPRGLRLQEEAVGCLANDMEDALQLVLMEDAVQLVLRSQMELTLSLLRREQDLYFNCSRSAARLEKGYTRHTLSDTRQFIREEKKLRDELRGNP